MKFVEKSTSIYVEFGNVSHYYVSVGSRTMNDEKRHNYVSHRMFKTLNSVKRVKEQVIIFWKTGDNQGRSGQARLG